MRSIKKTENMKKIRKVKMKWKRKMQKEVKDINAQES